MNYRSKKYSLTSNRWKKTIVSDGTFFKLPNLLTALGKDKNYRFQAHHHSLQSYMPFFKIVQILSIPRYKQTQQTGSIYAVDRYNPTSRVLAVNKFKRLVLNLVYKRANTYIYIYIPPDVYVSRSRWWKIMVNKDDGGSNDTAGSINIHVFPLLVNPNTGTKIRFDIYADISRPVYSNDQRILRIRTKSYRANPDRLNIRYDYYYGIRARGRSTRARTEADGSILATWPRDRNDLSYRKVGSNGRVIRVEINRP